MFSRDVKIREYTESVFLISKFPFYCLFHSPWLHLTKLLPTNWVLFCRKLNGIYITDTNWWLKKNILEGYGKSLLQPVEKQ